MCKINRHYLVDRSKHSVTQQLYRPQLRGLQDSSMDLGPPLSMVQRLKALMADREKVRTKQK